jgi:hypothetical protein
MAALLLGLYFLVLALLAVLGLHRLLLTAAALRAGRSPEPAPLGPDAPRLVVQLPLYNEAFVAERLLEAAARLRYPAGRLEVQVLDDSTDDTAQVVERSVARLAARGVPVSVVRRAERTGFKAGALAHGLGATDAELVAIFDADFVPAEDFLERTVPALLAAPDVGLVQARWGHLNRDVGWLTRAQAVFLDGHFGVEHRGRAALGTFFNFNGTAGVWRRRAIEEAGGWRADTITEDLDLSYRAQLAGWRFVYLDDVVAPAELPERWGAFRQQQARWVRGSVQTARLLLPRLLRSEGVPHRVRLDGALHLTQNFAYLAMAVLAALLPATVLVRERIGARAPGGTALLSGLDLTTLGAGTGAMLLFYSVALRAARERGRGLDLLFALCLGAGMSLANAREVWRGLWSSDAEFLRTPKRGAAAARRAVSVYRVPANLRLAALELAFAAYHLAALLYALSLGLWGPLPFLGLYGAGFLVVSLSVLRESGIGLRAALPLPPAAASELGE